MRSRFSSKILGSISSVILNTINMTAIFPKSLIWRVRSARQIKDSRKLAKVLLLKIRFLLWNVSGSGCCLLSLTWTVAVRTKQNLKIHILDPYLGKQMRRRICFPKYGFKIWIFRFLEHFNSRVWCKASSIPYLSGRQRAQNVDIASSIARCPCL